MNKIATITKRPSDCPKKTACFGFANAIMDNANALCKSIMSNKEIFPSSFQTKYSLSYLLTKSIDVEGLSVENIKSYRKYQNGMSFESIRSFDFRLNLADCDIVLRVNDECGKLFIEGKFKTALHCSNGAYLYILNELYSQANKLGVAA